MKTITIRDLRQRWPDAEAMLEHEKEILVTRDGKPVAKLLLVAEDRHQVGRQRGVPLPGGWEPARFPDDQRVPPAPRRGAGRLVHPRAAPVPQGGLGRVAIDGTKIKANASKHKAAMARDLAACIPGARLLVPPEVRHCSVVEAAALLAPELEAFLTAA